MTLVILQESLVRIVLVSKVVVIKIKPQRPMTLSEEQFLIKCPAFARQIGIEDLWQWNIVNNLVPLSWTNRFDKLDEMEYSLHTINCSEKHLFIRVLEAWDNGLNEV